MFLARAGPGGAAAEERLLLRGAARRPGEALHGQHDAGVVLMGLVDDVRQWPSSSSRSSRRRVFSRLPFAGRADAEVGDRRDLRVVDRRRAVAELPSTAGTRRPRASGRPARSRRPGRRRLSVATVGGPGGALGGDGLALVEDRLVDRRLGGGGGRGRVAGRDGGGSAEGSVAGSAGARRRRPRSARSVGGRLGGRPRSGGFGRRRRVGGGLRLQGVA